MIIQIEWRRNEKKNLYKTVIIYRLNKWVVFVYVVHKYNAKWKLLNKQTKQYDANQNKIEANLPNN